MNVHKQPTLDHPIHELLAARWSPCAFADRDVSVEELASLFEAARWSASSNNEQPWAFIIGTRSSPDMHARVLSCLVEGNQKWAFAAPVLAIACARLTYTRNGKPNLAATHDLGAAAASLTFEATSRGMAFHQMGGILPDRAREIFAIPEGVLPHTGIAIGYRGDPQSLPEPYRGRDLAPRTRKALAEFVFTNTWDESANL